MNALSRPWSRLTLAGKVILPLLFLLAAATLLLLFGVALGPIPFVVDLAYDTVVANLGIVRFVGSVTAILLLTVPTAFIIIYLEMKVIALMNMRLGPNRVGPWGTLQSTVHGFKVLAKEDFTPTGADVPVFTLAPAVVYLASVMAFLVLPFAPGLVGADMNIGLLYFFAVGSLGVVGLMMAGWSSFNKYSLLGGLRAAAQIVSYEIPLTLSIVGVVLLTGSLSLNTIILEQSGSFLDWFIFRQPLGFLIFFIAAAAEGSRTPFDLTEADSEIVAGFATEYSGMRFGFFFFAEYVNVFLLSALTVVLFLGGWSAPLDLGGLLAQVGLSFDPTLAPGQLGIGLLFGVALVPPIVILAIALPIWAFRSDVAVLEGPGHRLPALQRPGRRRPDALGHGQLRGGRGPHLVLRQDLRLRGRLRVDARHAAARARGPAHGLRLEMAAARRPGQPLRDRCGHRRRPADPGLRS